QDRESVTIAATMGALLDSSHDAGRQLWADVRVGDAAFDNTNFVGRGAGFDAPDGLPEEARYDTDRRAIWLATDDASKQAIEMPANKRAALKNPAEEPRPPDLGKLEPQAISTPPPVWDVEPAAWEKTARAVTAAFRRIPGVEDGQMLMRAERQTQRFLNSEGSWHHTGKALLEVVLRASARASDGTPVSDFRRFFGGSAADLPSQERLVAAAEELGQSLTRLASAGKTEEYSGPVLFTGDAAAVFFDRLLADKLSDPALPVMEGGRGG